MVCCPWGCWPCPWVNDFVIFLSELQGGIHLFSSIWGGFTSCHTDTNMWAHTLNTACDTVYLYYVICITVSQYIRTSLLHFHYMPIIKGELWIILNLNNTYNRYTSAYSVHIKILILCYSDICDGLAKQHGGLLWIIKDKMPVYFIGIPETSTFLNYTCQTTYLW